MIDDLLTQARRLARLDPTRPRQANLRRAVSAAYYAVFHFLVEQACRALMGSQADRGAFRHTLARAFTHANVRDACQSFAGGTLKAGAAKGLPSSFTIATAVRRIARTACELQDYRHAADDDLTERFLRADVLSLIRQARTAIRLFRKLPMCAEKRFFLACLWVWKELAGR